VGGALEVDADEVAMADAGGLETCGEGGGFLFELLIGEVFVFAADGGFFRDA
jgi:hypothetical protein